MTRNGKTCDVQIPQEWVLNPNRQKSPGSVKLSCILNDILPPKKVVSVEDVTSVTIEWSDSEKKLYGLIPTVQVWETSTLQQVTPNTIELDSITNPTEITVTFGSSFTGKIVIG